MAVAVAATTATGCETTQMREFESDMAEWSEGRDAALAARGITLRDFELMRLEFERPCEPLREVATASFEAWQRCTDATGRGCPVEMGAYMDAADERWECTFEADQLVSEWLGLDEGLWALHERRDSEREAERAARRAANPGGTSGWRDAIGFLGSVARVTLTGLEGDVPTLDLTRQIAGMASGGNTTLDAILGLAAAASGSASALAVGGLRQAVPSGTGSGELAGQLDAMAASCGGLRYAGTVDERDHGRFYCMRAYAAQCELRKAPNPDEEAVMAYMCSFARGCPHCSTDGPTETVTNWPTNVDPGDPRLSEYVPTPYEPTNHAECGLNVAADQRNCMRDRRLLGTCDLPVGSCPPAYEDARRQCRAAALRRFPDCGKTNAVIR